MDRSMIGLPEVVSPAPGVRSHIYNQFVITQERDALHEFVSAQGIGTEINYRVRFHLQECFRDLEYKAEDFPESGRDPRETLALPVYTELTSERQTYVVDRVVMLQWGR